MSITNVNRFLNVEDSHLRVVSGNVYAQVLNGNVYAQALNVGGITVGAAYGLQSVTNVSNTTNSTIEFTNTETSLVTSGDINMLHSSNNAAIKLNSNVVTEFPRSKKLIKYPRVALTSASQDGYVVTASSTLSTGTPANVPYTVFDESLTSFWHTQYPYYNTSNGSYAPGQTAGGTGTPANGTTLPTNELVSGHQGEWISLELPNKIKLDRLKVTGSTRLASGVTQFPKDVVVAVSDTGLSGSWSVLQTATLTSQNVSNHSVTINITIDASYYRYFALIVKSINSTATYSGTEIAQLELYGLPEYDPDAHGTDVVVKSPPNVPNTDWLDVYYDGQDYTSTPATVTDNSGNNLTGTLNGGVGFDTGYKAFTFDGVDDYISNIQSGYTSSNTYTASMWFNKTTNIQGALFQYGIVSGTPTAIGMYYYGSPNNYLISYITGSARADTEFNASYLPLNVWNHAASVYSPKGVTLYINGIMVAKNTEVSPTWNNSITISTTPHLTIGAQGDTSTGVISTTYFTGSIANFRLFKRALTSDEIWQLYAYQKEYFGRGDLGMTLKAGRLGIGTSEPRAALDVRGDIIGGCPAAFSVAYDTTSLSGNQTIIWNLVYHNVGNGYDSYSGLFTAPVSGYYHFTVWGMTQSSASGQVEFQFMKNGSPVQQRPYGDAGSNYGNATGSIIEYLAVNDTMSIFLTSGTTMYATSSQSYNGFSGFYLSS